MTTPGDRLGPIREGERVLSLDVTRGVALFGIFMVNMPFFALALGDVVQPDLAAGSASDRIAWVIIRTFFEFKFISIFSMLFGAGLVVQLTRARTRGQRGIAPYVRRIVVLLLIGIVHAFGLWYGDILLMYAVLAFPFLGLYLLLKSTRALLIAVAVLYAVGFMGTVAVSGLGAFQAQQLAGVEAMTMEEAVALDAAERPRPLEVMQTARRGVTDPQWLAAERRYYRDGPASVAFEYRAILYAAFVFSFGILSFGWRILAMFLLGAVLMRTGFFLPERRTWHRRAMAWGFGLGLPLEIGATAWVLSESAIPGWHSLITEPVHYLASMALALAYVGLIARLCANGNRLLQTVFAPAGRMALTVYLSETLISTFIMYWWGMGRFGSVSRIEMIGLVIAIYAALVVFAVAWMKPFTIGPLEWLWRSMSYLRPLPMRRAERDPAP